MLIANRPLFHTPPADGWLDDMTVTPATAFPGGYVTATFPDGTVLSVQPDGRFEHRPAGTTGPYELAERAGNTLTYRPGTPQVILTAGQ